MCCLVLKGEREAQLRLKSIVGVEKTSAENITKPKSCQECQEAPAQKKEFEAEGQQAKLPLLRSSSWQRKIALRKKVKTKTKLATFSEN